jgi:hypothetical protein
MAGIFKNQGINILLNVFFNPEVNAARAIAYQVNTAINRFVTNFNTAVNPQITKYYATGDKQQMLTLVFQSSKFSYFLLLILSMPFLLETQFILSVWLKELPEYVVLFSRLVILNALVDSLASPLITSALATGKIRQYQMVIGGTMLLNLPVSYVFLNVGFPPQSTMYIAIAIALVNLMLRLVMLRGMIQFPVKDFIFEVIFNVVFSTILAYLIPLIIINNLDYGLLRFILLVIVGFITAAASIYFIGLSKNEKKFIKKIVWNKIVKIFIKRQLK